MSTTKKSAGVLMPVASLPSRTGAGSFGKEARRFIDLLSEMGVTVWQILPLNPLGYGNSPYQPYSSFAGDELYIDLDELKDAGFLPEAPLPYQSQTPGSIDYPSVRAYKESYLRKAFSCFGDADELPADYTDFTAQEWVYLYAVFIALKKQNDSCCWNEWPKEQRDWILDKKYDISHLGEEIRYQMFLQYLFYTQWMKLKAYANSKGIDIMGDIPIYVGQDSLDVWSSREDFLLDEEYRPSFVAGVPPDYFSVTGQRWGNPIYNWDNLEKKGFTFWINRLKYSSKLYDIIRIDHFRAFDTYWKVVASCDTAIDGEWVEAPGYALFDEVYKQMPDIRIVAEDLGDIRPEVLTLRDHYNLMGMHVAEFALPYTDSVQPHQLIYTGTHDNQTAEGWYRSQSPYLKQKIRKILAKYSMPGERISKKLVRYVYGSCAELAIVTVADIIGLDDRARLNTPGTVGSPNWEWQLENFSALSRQVKWVQELIQKSNRE